MNKLIIPAAAVTAVTLLSGCQHVTVRHHYPQPVQVIEHRTVVVDRHHKPTPPVKVIKVVRPPIRVVAPPPKREQKRHRQEHGHPPMHRDERNKHRKPGQPKVRVIPVTPQVKRAGGFAAQVGHKERAAKPVQAHGKRNEEKPKQGKRDTKEHRKERREPRHDA